MITLALDQASRTTGWAIFCDDKLIDSDSFTVSQSDMAERLKKIRDNVNELISRYNVEQLILEDIQLQNSVQNNVTTYKALAEVIGVLTELAAELKLPYKLIYSSTWKSALGIKGRNRPEQKKNAQQWVLDNYGQKLPQDTCDAICIGASQLRTFNWG